MKAQSAVSNTRATAPSTKDKDGKDKEEKKKEDNQLAKSVKDRYVMCYVYYLISDVWCIAPRLLQRPSMVSLPRS